MHNQRILYVLAGAAGVRWVERVGGRTFRTYRRLKYPAGVSACDHQGEPMAMRNLLRMMLKDVPNNNTQRFDSLILVAPRAILDTLRASFSPDALGKTVACVTRDLSRIRDQDLRHYLPPHLVYRSEVPMPTAKTVNEL